MTVAEQIQKAIDRGRRVRVRFDDGLELVGTPLVLVDGAIVLKGPFALAFPLVEVVDVTVLGSTRLVA